MVLSEFLIDWDYIKRIGVRDAYGIHKLVYGLFPNPPRHFLYMDNENRSGKRILILSKEKPIVPQEGRVRSKEIPPNYLDWGKYAFQVKLNPVRRIDGKAVPVIGREALTNWFLGKQASWGVEVVSDCLEVDDAGVEVIVKGTRKITLSYAVFRGIFNVMNRELFRKAFEHGIGRAKAFGFGLLQIVKSY